ncbi:MAG: InlB B-repeat-containing protein, partial [Clostridiales bacterium]|nr:InlB B-repeat-containing protein [Clostridiales bacterium]
VNKATYEFGEDVYLGTEYGETAGKKVEAWYTDPALTGDAVTAIVAGSQGYKADFALYGKYTAKSFKATFNNADGTLVEEFTVKSGDNIPVPAENPTYNGWTFISWSPAVGVMGTEDIVFTAVYDSDNTYKASYYAADDTLIEEIEIYYGHAIDTPEAPVLTGKIFKEWADEEGKTPESYGTMPAKDLSFKASYVTAKYDPREKDEVQDPDPFTEYGYGITFNATEGEFADGSKTMQLGGTYGEIVSVPSGSEKPTRAGYVLRGWSATEGGSVIDPWAETVPDLTEVDVTYYAVWSEGTYNVTFSAIGKDANGNTVSGWFVTDSGNVTTITKQFGLGETIVYPDNPQGPTGYHFEAWETVQASMPGQDITINDAIYAVNENNIFYYLRKGDTDIYDEMNNVGYGDNVADYIAQEPDDIDIYGYLFKGWVDETGSSINTYLTMPDRDLTFYANLVAKKFDPADSGTDEDTIYGMGVIFDANIANASYDTIAVKAEFGKPITPPASPTCEGFRFLGWAGTMDAENAIIPFNEVLDKDLELEDEPVVFYGVWQDNSAAPVVKLIPTIGSTAMIERSKGSVKAVETYNQLTAKQLCYGVSIENVFAPFSDVYGDYETADNFESWFVYGLKVGMTVAEMSSFVEVTGEGRFEVLNLKGEVITSGKVGTGYIVKVYDNLGTFVEQFRVVIFGDEDGKANVNTTDIANLRNEFTTRAWSVKDDPNKFVAYKFRAMDSDQKGNINTTDAANFRAALFQTVQGDGKIFVLNQVTGRTEKVEP